MPEPIDSKEDIFLPQSDRLQILSAEEYGQLWGLPRFSQYDRDLFSSLTVPELEILDRLRTHRTKAHFLLQLGYFRARQRFFRFEITTVRDDLEYLRRRFLDNEPVSEIAVSDHTRKHHVALILGHFRYRLYGQEERLGLEQRAMSAARISAWPLPDLSGVINPKTSGAVRVKTDR